LISRLSLGIAYGRASRAADAVAVLKQASARCERVFGPDNRLTLGARGTLAAAYAAAGRPRKAAALHRKVLAGFERTLGPDHPTTRKYHADSE
jgi:hypothetical protein